MPEPPVQRDELMTVDQLADAYEMGRSTVWLVIKQHNLPRYRVPGEGKATFIRRADFERARTTPVRVNGNKKAAT